MIYRDRKGNTFTKTTAQDKFLNYTYSTAFGRALIKPFTNPVVSKLGGAILSTKASTAFIKSFIKSNNINMDEYEVKKFDSYNDFFTRKVKSSSRPVDMDKHAFISPADGKVLVYDIDNNLNFRIKNSSYSVPTLLQDDKLASEFIGGQCIVIRLSVDNYHRFCYIDNAKKFDNNSISGRLHTVNPIAFEYVPVFKENSREYCVLDTENFGKVVQMEVGALMVGKIVNYHNFAIVQKGQEKGKFEFGGSTIVLLVKEDSVMIDEDILDNSSKDIETIVYMGEKIGNKV